MSRPREKVCPECGKRFTAMNDRKRFCCDTCRKRHNDKLHQERAGRRRAEVQVNADAKVDSYLPSKPTTRRYEGVDTW